MIKHNLRARLKWKLQTGFLKYDTSTKYYISNPDYKSNILKSE